MSEAKSDLMLRQLDRARDSQWGSCLERMRHAAGMIARDHGLGIRFSDGFAFADEISAESSIDLRCFSTEAHLGRSRARLRPHHERKIKCR
jgi:hypothetical protein